MEKFHYVYLIEEISTNKKYIGSRSSLKTPEEDLGKKYFSSSTIKEFIQRQKTNPEDYSYTILEVFESRPLANEYEYNLLKSNDVRNNESFYNRGVFGNKGLYCSPIRDMVVVHDCELNRNVRIHKDEYYGNKHKYRGVSKPTGESNPKAKTILIYDENDVLRFSVKGGLKKLCEEHKMPYPAFSISHKNGGVKLGLTEGSRGELRKRLNHYFVGWYALEEGSERTDFREPDCDINEVRYSGLCSSLGRDYMAKGKLNANAKVIEIYNAEGVLQYTCEGNFHETLRTHKLPASLQLSYLKNAKIYYNRPKHRFHNWYAVLKGRVH